MQRCLDLAEIALGETYPNPIVGCVIVHQCEIIGEGWHKKAGDAHAEVNAINSVKDKTLLTESILYVSLEPCVHYGKTPPCSELIIKHKIPHVVVGCTDLYSKVSGKGIKSMRESGIKVDVGVLKDKCVESHKRFFTFHNKKRPYIILKWAETKDGFIAPLKQKIGEPFWITSIESKTLVHKWRSQESSLLIGTNTAELDNPSLTVRLWKGNNPLRIVIDKNLKLNNSLNIFNNSAKSLVFNDVKNFIIDNIEYCMIDFSSVHLEIMKTLYNKGVHSLIIEGGRETLQSFIDIDLWDEARVFVANQNLKNGVRAPKIKEKHISEEMVSSDLLRRYRR
jgi:diaminohydroxyphosphoribosylaminopyrimidine deaminase/5-amino-6-(5-phosphoribosylamino)uracil reductase